MEKKWTIKELRKKHKMTQAELGILLNCGKSAISTYETGDRVPRWETIINIADLFGTTIDELALGEDAKAVNKSGTPA